MLIVVPKQKQHLIGSRFENVFSLEGLLIRTLKVDFSRTFVEEPGNLSLFISLGVFLVELLNYFLEGSREDAFLEFISFQWPSNTVQNVNLEHI